MTHEPTIDLKLFGETFWYIQSSLWRTVWLNLKMKAGNYFHFPLYSVSNVVKSSPTTIHTTLLDSSPAVYIILYTIQYIPFHIQDSPLYTYKDCLPFVCDANTSMNILACCDLKTNLIATRHVTESVLTYSLQLNIGATYWEAIFACKFHYHQHLYHTTWHVFNRWRLLHLRTVSSRLLL